ncbi:MAG: hypothetical protein ABIV39_04945 [Verrucomicrobiota bacterium]
MLRRTVIGAILSVSFSAKAGMTVYGLRDIYRLRLEEISFFIVLFLTCAFLFKLLWNYAIKGFSFLPRLKYLQALCLSVLFGLLTLLILTMISGIREVLTPGAWRHQGTSYRLNDPAQEPARRRSLEQLRGALFGFAKLHDGRFPSSDFGSEISEKLWEAPDQIGTRYIYSGGLTTNDVGRALAIEPLNFGDLRFVLFVSGELRQMSKPEIENLLSKRGQP